jgi:hypothetical protein
MWRKFVIIAAVAGFAGLFALAPAPTVLGSALAYFVVNSIRRS